jgi:hypothetical protein
MQHPRSAFQRPSADGRASDVRLRLHSSHSAPSGQMGLMAGTGTDERGRTRTGTAGSLRWKNAVLQALIGIVKGQRPVALRPLISSLALDAFYKVDFRTSEARRFLTGVSGVWTGN